MGSGTSGRAVLIGPVSNNDMGFDGPFRRVVIRRQSGHIQECEETVLMHKDSLAQSLPRGVGIRGRGERKQSRFDAPDLASEHQGRPSLSSLNQTIGVCQETFDFFLGSGEIRWWLITPLFADFPTKMDKAFLFSAMNLGVVGVKKVTDENPLEEFSQDTDRDVASTTFVDAKVGPGVINERPEPMATPLMVQPVSSTCLTMARRMASRI